MKRASVIRNDRGVALLIVLLATALLVALVFEFAYAARVSLREAANFRDSRRAYFLARAGVNIFAKYGDLRESMPHGEWTMVPMVSAGDTELRLRWEDEAGKIRIGPGAVDAVRRDWFRQLLTETGVSQEIADRLFGTPPVTITLISELHRVMNDEEYGRIERYITAHSANAVNMNTAAEAVLKSVLAGKDTQPGEILMMRQNKPIEQLPTDINNANYTTKSTIFRVQSFATVGEYTKQVDAVVVQGGAIQYWRAR